MRNILLIILTVVFAGTAFGQVDRSTQPEPGPAPEIKLGDYESFKLKNGLTVFVVENRKLPRVSFSLIVDRDPVLEGDKKGYVSLAGQLLREGTTNRTKAELDEEVDFIGGNLSTSSNSVFASSLSEYKDKMMELMADVVQNPAFPEESFDKLKKQAISGLDFNKSDPEAIARRVFDVVLYGKSHPYGELDTEETYENVSLEDCKNYYQTYFKPNISYLAVVGDINKKEARELVSSYMTDWGKGDVPDHKYEDPSNPSERSVAIVNRDNAVQSVINIGNVTDLQPGSEDVIPLRIGNQILGGGSMGRLFKNLREDKAYTYGAYSRYDSDELVGSFTASASARNEVTDSAATEFYKELNRIREEKLSPEELQNAKNYITGSFARSLESPETIARFAINTARYDLPRDYYKNYLKKVEKVSLQDVQQATQQHIKPDNSTILVVGKAQEIAPKLERFGPVTYYDRQGNVIEAPTFKEADISPEELVNKYIDALGGSEALDKIKDVTMKMEGSLQGRNLVMTSKQMAPNKSIMSLNLNMQGQEMEVMNMKFDGEDMKRVQQGQEVPVSEEEVNEAKISQHLFPELQYLENEDFELEVTSIKTVNGEDAYEMEVTYPTGKEVTEYYSVETGLKIRETETREGPNGQQATMNQDYKDYKAVQGVKFPHTWVIPLGPSTVTMEVTDIKVNSGLSADQFEVASKK